MDQVFFNSGVILVVVLWVPFGCLWVPLSGCPLALGGLRVPPWVTVSIWFCKGFFRTKSGFFLYFQKGAGLECNGFSIVNRCCEGHLGFYKVGPNVELVSKESNHFGGIASFFRDWAPETLTGGA